MRLKKLEIHGFKSFLDKSVIHFPTGISAVVGPNGCGKSNILDALRWVMGEQSVKQLRGKSMEDVIFAGANGKPPLNMAEVNLILANDNGSAPEELRDYAEIMVTRRLYRSGESAYLLNKHPCRLKDVTNLFLGSGMGARSYAVIQQGNIGAITDAGPEERRLFLEEAAGVTRFKQRRIEALRKVQGTQQNLYRVMDIIAEIKRQMAGLKRQARKAELYKGYQERIKTMDALLAIHYHDSYDRQIQEASELLRELRDGDIGDLTELKKLDAAVEAVKLQRWEKNQAITDRKARRFELQRGMDRTENDLAHLREETGRLAGETKALEDARRDLVQKNEKITVEIDASQSQIQELESQAAAVRQELERERAAAQAVSGQATELSAQAEAAKARLMDLVTQEARYRNVYQTAESTKQNLARRRQRADEEALAAERAAAAAAKAEGETRTVLEGLKVDLARLGQQIDARRTELNAHNQSLARQVKAVQTRELQRSQVRSQHTALKKMEDNYEWYRDGVKAIMKTMDADEKARRGIMGLVANALVPEAAYDAAVEAALGEAIQYILVASPEEGLAAIDLLRHQAAGRCGFIPTGAAKPLAPPAPPPAPARRLLDHVRVEAGCEAVAEALLGHVVMTEELTEALALFNRNGHLRTIVTRRGEVITSQGILIGGGADNASGILAKKQEIKDLEAQMESIAREIEAARALQGRLETEARERESALQRLLERKAEATHDAVETEKALYRASEDAKNARRRLEIARLEQDQLAGEETDAEQQLVETNRVLQTLSGDAAAAQAAVADLAAHLAAVNTQSAAFHQRVVEIQLRQTALNARHENSRHTLRRLREFQQDGLQRLEGLAREIAGKRERRNTASQRILELEAALALKYDELKRLTADLEQGESEYQRIDAQLQESDTAMATIRSRREENLEKLRLLELELSQKRLKQETIASRLQERYQQSLEQFRQALADVEEPKRLGVGEIESELARCQSKVAQFQDVNLGAIKEYEQLKTRYDFLNAQQNDLNQALEDLQKVIRKINRVTQERFLETFHAVNEKLKEVFPRLFEGGTAQLVLTDPDDPLETGVEFMIHPPGKKLTRMSLLSGGEKALSAIAFIFSIFLLKPTSFCLLDEIDAPLDEANVTRFNNLLRIIGEKSQIIMITHNKRSMEFADTLFGITMEQKGISKVVSVNLARATN
jgi:chromosome segregation protein